MGVCAISTAALPPNPTVAESPTKVHAVSTATLQSSSWPAFLSYTLFAPTYLAGPIVTAAEFYQQVSGRDPLPFVVVLFNWPATLQAR